MRQDRTENSGLQLSSWDRGSFNKLGFSGKELAMVTAICELGNSMYGCHTHDLRGITAGNQVKFTIYRIVRDNGSREVCFLEVHY